MLKVVLMCLSMLGILELVTATAFGQTSDAKTLSEILRLSVECPIEPDTNKHSLAMEARNITTNQYIGDDKSFSIRTTLESRLHDPLHNRILVFDTINIYNARFSDLKSPIGDLEPPLTDQTRLTDPSWRLAISCAPTPNAVAPTCISGSADRPVDLTTQRRITKIGDWIIRVSFCDKDKNSD
jgi:hypothetical protein